LSDFVALNDVTTFERSHHKNRAVVSNDKAILTIHGTRYTGCCRSYLCMVI